MQMPSTTSCTENRRQRRKLAGTRRLRFGPAFLPGRKTGTFYLLLSAREAIVVGVLNYQKWSTHISESSPLALQSN